MGGMITNPWNRPCQVNEAQAESTANSGTGHVTRSQTSRTGVHSQFSGYWAVNYSTYGHWMGGGVNPGQIEFILGNGLDGVFQHWLKLR